MQYSTQPLTIVFSMVNPHVFIHPRPWSGSQIFDFLFHIFFPFFYRTKINHLTSFWPVSLDVKTQEVEAIIDMCDACLFIGQLQVQFVFQIIFDLLPGLFYPFYIVLTENDKIIRVSDETVVSKASSSSLSAAHRMIAPSGFRPICRIPSGNHSQIAARLSRLAERPSQSE